MTVTPPMPIRLPAVQHAAVAAITVAAIALIASAEMSALLQTAPDRLKGDRLAIACRTAAPECPGTAQDFQTIEIRGVRTSTLVRIADPNPAM